ncbi:hypothetical protein M9458_021012, partial [Cirrhinus mrigala]
MSTGTSRAAQSVSKTPCHLPVGKLVPLPIPCRPWSHIAVDFVTDLANSSGNTCVLVVIDCFSKVCKLIPLKCLPTALETAKTCPLATICKLTARLSAKSRSSDVTSGDTATTTSTAGASFSPRQSMHRTPSVNPLPGSRPSTAVFNCCSSHGQKSPQRFQLWNSVHIHFQCAVQRHKTFTDARHSSTPSYQPGEKVWLSTRDLHLRLPCKKLSPRYISLFQIQRQLNEVTHEGVMWPGPRWQLNGEAL